MARSKLLAIAVSAVLVALSFHQVMSLKCWDCIWDSRTPESREFCKDPFDASNISDAQRNWSYRNCTIAPERALNHTVHCRKVTRKEYNATVISRSCHWKPMTAPKDQCFDSFTPSYIKNELCQICAKDGCNGANSAIQFTLNALLIAAPMIVSINLSI